LVKRYNSLILVLIISLISSIIVYAIDEPKNTIVNVGESGRFTETNSNMFDAEGGNVTNINLHSNTSTNRWQGISGNVSGNLVLGRGSDIFFDFGNAPFDLVIATTGNDIDWSLITNGSSEEVDNAWNFVSGVDKAVNVFTQSSTIKGINNVPSITLHEHFLCGVLFSPGSIIKNNFVFIGVINQSKVGFAGQTWDYQLMIPASGIETYNMYLSLE
jgi:hypothetical protein